MKDPSTLDELPHGSPVSGPQSEATRRPRVAVFAAGLAAVIEAVRLISPLLGGPPTRSPFLNLNLLLLALVHLADEPRSPVHIPPRARTLLALVPLVLATVPGLALALNAWMPLGSWFQALEDQVVLTPASLTAIGLIAASRLIGDRPDWVNSSAALAVVALPPAIVSLIGWVLGPTLLSTVGTPMHMSPPAAVVVFALVLARLTSPLQVMPLRWIFGDSPTASWLRRWLVIVLLFLPILLLVQAQAAAAGWILPHAAALMSTVAIVVVGVSAILWSASKLHRFETLLRAAHIELEQRVAHRTHELALANEALNRDIAERRRMDEQLRASRERLRSVTESAIDPILTADSSGKIVQWNQAATRVFGYPESAILGARLDMLIPELQVPDAWEARFEQRIGAWLGRTRRCVGQPSAGGAMDLEVSVATWHDRGARFYSIIGRDVTARTRAELELTMAKDAAEAANRSKSQFLANISHEIRTPMNVILGMTELIGEAELSDDQRRYLRSTREAGDHLLEIINDILDLSKVEAGALTLDEVEFDVRELAEQAIEFLAPRAYARHLEVACRLDVALPQIVVGDPQRLRQVLVNLLGNAVKFTDSGYVALSVDVVQPDRVRFAVTDTGCGIPDDKLGVIFESFTQVDASSTRRHGGTGLGLAISRQLVERMGGQMRVASTLGQGSTFEVEVPLQFRYRSTLTASQDRLIEPELAERLLRSRAIVAGGQTVFRQALGGQLAQMCVNVTDIANLHELLPQLRAAEQAGRPYDLLLLDADMGELDGYEAAAQVTHAGLTTPPRIALTKPSEDTDDARRARDTGVAVIIRKPVRRKPLLDALALALGTPEPRAIVTTSESAGIRPTTRSLLVVDDASDNLRLMEAFLRETGWHVETAEDGQRAVEHWQQRAFDVILMDLQMPVMDGLAATRKIRKLEAAQGRPPTPIIAVTAHALEEARAESLAAGCTAFLAKPLRRTLLLDALTELFLGRPPVSELLAENTSPIAITVDPLLMSLIPGFLTHRQEDADAIVKALGDDDFAGIQLLGHSMKGSGGSYGFDVISSIGHEIELAAIAHDAAAIRLAVATLSDYLRRVRVL